MIALNTPPRDRWRTFAPLILTIQILLSIVFSFRKALWIDERATIWRIDGPWNGVLDRTMTDVHPPLYYVYAKLFEWVGGSGSSGPIGSGPLDFPFGLHQFEWRLATALLIPLTSYVGARAIRRRVGTREAVWFMILYPLSPTIMASWSDIRMYTLCALFVLLTALSALACYEHGRMRDWTALGITGFAAFFTQYFGALPVTMIYALLVGALVRRAHATNDAMRAIRPLAWVCAAITIVVATWFPFFAHSFGLHKTKTHGSFSVTQISEVVVDLFTPIGIGSNWDAVIGALIVLTLSIALIRVLLTAQRGSPRTLIHLCAAVVFGMVILALSISALDQPLLRARYFIPVLPMFCCCIALMIPRLSHQWRLVMVAVTLLPGIVLGASAVRMALAPPADILLGTARNYCASPCTAVVSLSDGSSAYLMDRTHGGRAIPFVTAAPHRTDASPSAFISILDASDRFDPSEHRSILVIVDAGTPIPQEWLKLYPFSTRVATGTTSEDYFQVGKLRDLYELSRTPIR